MLDKVTEMVAHMIGIFHTNIEEARVRDSFLKINAQRHDDAATDALQSHAPTLKSSYQLEDFIPRIRYEAASDDTQASYFNAPSLNMPQMPVWWGAPQETLPEQVIKHGMNIHVSQSPSLTLEPPGAVVTISHQYAYLSDNDFLRLTDSGITFINPAIYDAQLHAWHAAAQAISAPVASDLPALDGSAHAHALTLHDQIAASADPGVLGAVVTVFHGQAVTGIHENGVEVQVATQLDAVMPAYQTAQTAAADTDDADAPPAWTPSPFPGADPALPLPQIDPGHEVVTGANLMINQTSITSAWLDAPVIAVMGDVISVNIISQTNVLVEHGSYSGLGAALGSNAYNSAAISLTTSAPSPGKGADAAEGGTAGLPVAWAVTRIDGDLLTVNHSQQFSFMADHDRADIGFFSANTYIALGDNTVVNLTTLLEIGYGYDLIIVGGSMITINQIMQMNVLIDNDLVSYDGMQPTHFSAGDNLLFNGASINVVGVDSHFGMKADFAAAAQSLSAGGLTIAANVARDSVFEGTDILRVLYISGDAVTINLVNQTNILGDSDQVHLALDNFQSATGADITLTTGSNATINLASITQIGVDSTVFVGGEVYSDALLYQAGFIDTAANPLGVSLPALASEAVVFLADGLISSEAPQDAGIAPTALDGAQTPDVMQSMLA